VPFADLAAAQAAAAAPPGQRPAHSSGPVEFERVIPPSGNLMVARR
jgi:hypothetical protein